MERRIFVVGIGPGDPAYISERVRQLLADARQVLGFASAIAVVRHLLKVAPRVITFQNQDDVIRNIVENDAAEGNIVFCCYGDPNFSDKEFLQHLQEAGLQFELIPGISSVQIACARAQVLMEDCLFITFHKQGNTEVEKVELLETLRRGRRHVIALPRPWDFMPSEMARWLMEEGLGPYLPVRVFERLTLPDEREYHFTLLELARRELGFSDLSIVLFPLK